MIAVDEQPVWFPYLEMNNNLDMVLRDDTPDDIREAYEAEQRRISESNEPIYKE
jgi:hypothetical protein